MTNPSFLRRLASRISAAVQPRKPIRPPSTSGQQLSTSLMLGKTVLIVGAGPNIGRGIAREMVTAGANLILVDRDNQQCQQRLQELSSADSAGNETETTGSGWLRSYTCDIRNQDQVETLCQALLEAGSQIDALIHTVGIQPESSLMESRMEQWRQTFDANLLGPLYLIQQLLAETKQPHPLNSIVFVSSIHQWQTGGWAGYSTSKAALGMMIEELAVELAPRGIRVNGIAPGWVIEDEQGQPLHSRDSLLHQTSIPAIYIGRAAVHLCSDYFSEFTTGAVLKVDAGMSLVNHRTHTRAPV